MKQHREAIEIAAPPEAVWELISEVTNMGRWSPICRRSVWVGEPGRPVPGARFKGWNRLWGFRWSRECVVTDAEPGRVFAFHTLLHGRESVRWRYVFEPSGAATRVVESYEIVREPWYLAIMPHVARLFRRASSRGVATTLERVKAAAEAATT